MVEIYINEPILIEDREYVKSKDAAMTFKEYETLKKALTEDKERILLFLGARAGMRIGEILQCRKEWLRFTYLANNKVLQITIPECDKDLYGKGIWCQKDTRKNKKEKLRNSKKRITYLFDIGEATEVYMFFQYNKGLKLTRQRAHQITKEKWSKIINRPSERHLTPHSLRSTAINYLYYKLNLDPKVIAIMVGHASIATTMRHYTAMTPQMAEMYLEDFFKKKNE